jgi:hypothetical protein
LDETDYILEKAFDCIEDYIKEHTKWLKLTPSLATLWQF